MLIAKDNHMSLVSTGTHSNKNTLTEFHSWQHEENNIFIFAHISTILWLTPVLLIVVEVHIRKLFVDFRRIVTVHHVDVFCFFNVCHFNGFEFVAFSRLFLVLFLGVFGDIARHGGVVVRTLFRQLLADL